MSNNGVHPTPTTLPLMKVEIGARVMPSVGNVSMNTWIIIALAWLVMGLLCYAVILRFFPPTPLPGRARKDGIVGTEKPRPFSIRHLPQIVIGVIPIALISPFLLFVLVCYKLGKPTSADSK